MLSVFITPWTNPTSIHRATSSACASTTRRYSSRYGFSASAASGWWRAMAWSARRAQHVGVAGGGGVLERAHPQVARGHPAEHRAGQQLSRAAPARRWRRPTGPASSGSRARASPRRSGTRAASGRPRPCRRRRGRTACAPTLQVQVAAAARRSTPRRAAAPGRRRGAAGSAELVARVGLRDRRDALRQPVAVSSATPAGARSAAASSPSSAASSLLSTSSSGAGAGAAVHGTDSPGTRGRTSRRARTAAARRSCSRGYVARWPPAGCRQGFAPW